MRHLLALLVSSCLAWFLTSFMLFAVGTGFAHLVYIWSRIYEFIQDLSLELLYPVVFIGPIMFILAVVVLFLGILKVSSAKSYVIGFVILWIISLSYSSYLAHMELGPIEYLMAGIVPGAICGLVYSRIAVKNQPV